jgi:hypothetical protein
LDTDWSHYPREKEVLLLPNFCYQVLSVGKDPKEPKTTIIEVIEIPHQNLLEYRPLYSTRIIWLDLNIYKKETEQYRNALEKEFPCFTFCDNMDECVKEINANVRTVLITAGGIGA